MRKWLPGVLIAATFAISLATFRQLAQAVRFPAESFLPFVPGGTTQFVPRAFAAFGLPTIALLIWLLLLEAPVGPLGRASAHLFSAATRPRYEVFASSYRLIVLWVVCIPLAVHVALLGSGLGWKINGARLLGVVFGGGLILMGNLFPRLRQNPIAGIRTARTMADPVWWARVHRTMGTLWLIAGALTLLVALLAPRFALVAWAASLVLAAIVGTLLTRSNTMPDR